MKKILIILVCLLLIGAGCNQNSNSANNVTNQGPNITTPTGGAYSNTVFLGTEFGFEIPDGWSVTEEDDDAKLVMISDSKSSDHITIQLFSEDPTTLIESHLDDPTKSNVGAGSRDAVQLYSFNGSIHDQVFHTIIETNIAWFVISSSQHDSNYKLILNTLEI